MRNSYHLKMLLQYWCSEFCDYSLISLHYYNINSIARACFIFLLRAAPCATLTPLSFHILAKMITKLAAFTRRHENFDKVSKIVHISFLSSAGVPVAYHAHVPHNCTPLYFSLFLDAHILLKFCHVYQSGSKVGH